MPERVIATTVLDDATHRRILVTLSLDDDAVVVEVRGHGPLLVCADDDVCKRLRELVLDKSIPPYKGESDGSGIGRWFAEAGRQLAELGEDPNDPKQQRAIPSVRRIAVALTVDGPHVLVEAPPRHAMRLRPDIAYTRLRELVDDPEIPDVAATRINPRTFMRGVGRAIGELAKDDEK